MAGSVKTKCFVVFCLWTGTEERRMGTEPETGVGWGEGWTSAADTDSATKWHNYHQTGPSVNRWWKHKYRIANVKTFCSDKSKYEKKEDTVPRGVERRRSIAASSIFQTEHDKTLSALDLCSDWFSCQRCWVVIGCLSISRGPWQRHWARHCSAWQYSGHISPDLDLTPAITTNRHGRHIPRCVASNARPLLSANVYLSVNNSQTGNINLNTSAIETCQRLFW